MNPQPHPPLIIHVDMDAFFASVEQRDNPDLQGKPVAVGGSAKGRGVVAAASYEARKFGVHSAMAGTTAARLCPNLVFVKSDLRKYATVGKQVREIFLRYTPTIEPLSLDEAFLDVSATAKLFGSAAAIGQGIRNDIRNELNLPCSVGIAPRKFIAKIASDLQKPNGFVQVREEQLQSFLDPLPVQRLWGVGKVTLERLHKFGIQNIRDVRNLGSERCQRQFGGLGQHLWNLANAIDDRKVIPDHNAKSIGHERTFHDDVNDTEFLQSALSFLASQVSRRLRATQRLCYQVSIKYRLQDFRTFTRNLTLDRPSDETIVINQAGLQLLNQIRKSKPDPVRLIGISVGHLTEEAPAVQLTLFDEDEHHKQSTVDQLSDQLFQKFGEAALYRASGHQWIAKKKDQQLDSPNRTSESDI